MAQSKKSAAKKPATKKAAPKKAAPKKENSNDSNVGLDDAQKVSDTIQHKAVV